MSQNIRQTLPRAIRRRHGLLLGWPGYVAGLRRWAIARMCRWLGVSKFGYYEWRSRPQSAAAARRELLKIKTRALLQANDGAYGYRRMVPAPAVMHAAGPACELAAAR